MIGNARGGRGRGRSLRRRFWTRPDGTVARFEWLEPRTLLTGVTFSAGVLTVDGSTAADTILIAPTADQLKAQVTINGQVLSNTIPLASINQINVVGHEGDDTITLRSIDKSVDVDGGDGANKLVVGGHAANNTFSLTSDTSLTVNGFAYTLANVASLRAEGQSGNDVFTDSRLTPSLPITFDGGAGVDTLHAADMANTWNIVVVNGGNINGLLTFGNVENLTGGTDVDTFKLSAGKTIAGNIDGGGGTDLLSYAGYTTPVTFNLKANSATDLNGYGTGVGGLLNVEQIQGGSGSDTLVGYNATSTWSVTGLNSGSVNAPGVGSMAFSSFENLTGGSSTDLFQFADAAGITGKLDGGAGGNTIDFSAYTTSVTFNLQAKTFAGARTATYANVQSLVGAGATTLVIGQNNAATWGITDVNTGTVSGYRFSGVGALRGGSFADTFVMYPGSSITGGINGNGGSDTLSFASFASPVTVNLATTSATGVANITSIESIVGSGSSADVLMGPNQGVTWNVNGSNTGSVNGISYSAFEKLVGGTGGDTFVLAKNRGFAGTIDGGGGINELDYSAYTVSIVVDLNAGTASNISGGIANISDVFGGSASDTLLGSAADNFLFGNGGNDYIDGRAGNDVLTGGAGNDKLIGGNGRDLLFGGLGADNLNGGLGEDILFNGTTNFDTDIATLDAMLTFWKGAGTFSARVSQLRAGTVANVSFALNSTNIFDDAAVDTLSGGGNLDGNWFFAKLTSPAKDIISDLSANDVVN